MQNKDALVYGNYTLLDHYNPAIYAYLREGGRTKMLVVLNFSSARTKTRLPTTMRLGEIILNNLVGKSAFDPKTQTLTLDPYQALVYRVN